MNKLISGIILLMFAPSVVLATTYDTTGISFPKEEGARFSASDFNSAIGAIQGIFHDDGGTWEDLTDDRFKIGGALDSDLMFEVAGKFGATQYCDTDGLYCFTSADVSSGELDLWDADSDTGIQVEESADEDKIHFDTAGEERMVITDDGNIGFGTDTPEFKLHVEDTVDDRVMLRVRNLDKEGENVFAQLGAEIGNLEIGYSTGFQIYAHGKNRTNLFNGDVPLAGKVQFRQSSNEDNTGLIIHTSNANSPIILGTVNKEGMRLDTSNNLGIGQSTPTARTHIKSSTSDDSAYALKIDDSVDVKNFHVRNDGQVELKNFTFPITDGTVGQILKTDGSGALTWNDDESGSIWIEKSSPADYIEAVSGGISTNGVTLYGTNANTHINLGFGTSATGYSGQNYSFVTIGGGGNNTSSYENATVSGGYNNTSSNYGSFVGGGEENSSSGSLSGVVAGNINVASGTYSFVGGGYQNTASGTYSVIPGGTRNATAGDYSVVLGQNMQLDAGADRTFVYGTSTTAQSISTANAFLIFPKGDSGSLGVGVESPTATAHFKGTTATSAAYSLKVNDSSDVNLFRVRNDGLVTLKNYSLPTADGTIGQILKTDGSGALTWQDDNAGGSDLFDTDIDTGIQVEESADEDVIRFDAGGTEVLTIDADGIISGSQIETSLGGSVYMGGDTGINDDGTDNNNVGLGKEVLYFNTDGYNNIAQGYRALYMNTSGYANIALGANSIDANTGGYYNIGLGYSALGALNNASYNIGIGAFAGANISSGSNNIFIGKGARASSGTDTNSIVIGDNLIGNGSNTVTLGNDSITETHLKGVVVQGASSSAPTGVEGGIYFNSTDKHFYGHNGTAWVQLDN